MGPQSSPASADDVPRSLAELAAGTTGVVSSLRGGRGLTTRLLALGFTPGAEVTIMQNRGRGAMIVMVRGVRVALGRGQAAKVEIAAR